MPLVAKLSDGSRINIFQALELDDNQEYYCPLCNSKMHIVRSVKRTPHFRHNPGTSCGLGGESLRHLELKSVIGLWLMSKEWDVSFEEKIGNTIADIIARKDDITIRVEVQCSKIDLYSIAYRIRVTREVLGWNAGCLWMFDYAKYNSFRSLANYLPKLYFIDYKSNIKDFEQEEPNINNLDNEFYEPLVVINNEKVIPLTQLEPSIIENGIVVLDKSDVFKYIKINNNILCPKCLNLNSIESYVNYNEFEIKGGKYVECKYVMCPICGFSDRF